MSLQIHLTLMRVEELVRLLKVRKSSPCSVAEKAMSTAMRSQLRRGKTMPQSFESWLGVNLIEPEVYHEASEGYSYLTSVRPISAQTKTSHYCCQNTPDAISVDLVSSAMFVILGEGVWHARLCPPFRSCPRLKLVGF